MVDFRDKRQEVAVGWSIEAFGQEQSTNLEQRGLRLLEEAIEAAQAAGVRQGMAHNLVQYVFSRPVGHIRQELGGVGICTLILAYAANVSADACEEMELQRVLSKPKELFIKRNQDKNDAGFLAESLKK